MRDWELLSKPGSQCTNDDLLTNVGAQGETDERERKRERVSATRIRGTSLT